VTDKRQIIGRSEETEVALLEPTVSRRHAAVNLQNGEVWLEDLDSKHGTFVNSKRITRTRLKEGDIVVFGLSIVLRLEETDEQIPPAMPLRVPGAMGPPFGPIGTADYGSERGQQATLSMPETERDTALHWTAKTTKRKTRELKRVKNQLVKARKMAGAGYYCVTLLPDIEARLARLCHRMRHPESADGAVEQEELQGALESLLAGISRISEAIGVLPVQLLEPTPLVETLRRALAVVKAETHAVRFTTELCDELRIRADPSRLATALIEVLSCATRFMRPGQPINVTLDAGEDLALLTVVSNGSGIPADVLEGVFNPLVSASTHWELLGAGLFEARQIILSFGGTLDLRSEVGISTTFVVRLPRSD
jgi:signal transduction histidine kinase